MLGWAREAARSAPTEGDPFYLYDIDHLVGSVQSFARLAAHHGSHPGRVFFPMFANPNLELLRALARRVPSCGVLVNSPEEAEILDSESIGHRDLRVFTGGVVGRAQLRTLARFCGTVHCSSLGDLEALLEVTRDRSLGPLRLGLRIDLRGDALKGLGRSEFEAACRLVDAAGLRIASLHSYPGTEIDSIEELLLHSRLFLEFAADYPVETLNFGGGFGYDYATSRSALDLERFFQRFGVLVRSTERRGKLRSDVEFAWEPGRVLGASAGAYVCRVIEVRPREPGFRDVYVDGTFAHLLAPRVRNRKHRVAVVAPNGECRTGAACWTRLCGATTLSTDTILPGQVLMPEAMSGDLIMVWDVGCYGRSGSYNFLCRRLPAEVGVESGALRVLRAAQRTPEIFGMEAVTATAREGSASWLEKAV